MGVSASSVLVCGCECIKCTGVGVSAWSVLGWV